MKNHFRKDICFLFSSNHLLFLLGCQSSPCPVSENGSNGVLHLSLSTAFNSTKAASSFIGFSWGPLADAFPPAAPTTTVNPNHGNDTPANLLVPLLVMVAYFPPLVLLPTIYPTATVLLVVLTHSARTASYSERVLPDALMRRGGTFQIEKL